MTDETVSPGATASLWTPDLELGIPLIDGQHRKLVDHLSAVRAAIASGKPTREVLQAMAFLEDYTAEHFHTEERYMSQHRYPDIEKHREAHVAFRANVARAVQAVDRRQGRGDAVDLVQRMLISWYVRHIRGTDQKYVDHVKGRNRQAGAD